MLWRVWRCFKYLLQYHRCPFPLQLWLYFNRLYFNSTFNILGHRVKVKIWALGFTKAIMILPVLKCRITVTNKQNYAFKCCNSNITFCKFTFKKKKKKIKGCIICLIYMVFHSWPNVPFHGTWGLKWKLTARNYLYKMNSVKYV